MILQKNEEQTRIMSALNMNEKTLYDLLRDIWAAKFYLFGGSFLMMIVAYIFILACVPHYKIEMILYPAQGIGQDVTAEISAPEGTLAVRQSQDNAILPFKQFEYGYYAPSTSGKLIENQIFMDFLKKNRSFVFSNGRSFSSPVSLGGFLKKRVKLEPLSGTELMKFVYYAPDPAQGIKVLKTLHQTTDNLIRINALVQAQRRIDYLSQKIENEAQPEQKRILSDLLIGQERLKVLASIDQSYAALVFEPPYASAVPRWPDPYLIYPVALMIGALLGFLIYGFRHARA